MIDEPQTTAKARWYQIDIAAPHQTPDPKSNLVRERDNLPAWIEIMERRWDDTEPDPSLMASGEGWASCAAGGGNLDSVFRYQDFPDKRQIMIKTNLHHQINDVSKFPGVSTKERDASGFWMVFGVIFNLDELRESFKLQREGGPDGDKDYSRSVQDRFYAEVWPRVKDEILRTITRHEPEALVCVVDSRNAKAIFIKTRSEALIDSIVDMDHVGIDELDPDIELDDIARMVQKWESLDRESNPK